MDPLAFGFDLNGTITEEPDSFRAIMRGLVLQSHEVHILTGAMPSLPNYKSRTYDNFYQRLKDQGLAKGVHYTHFHVITIDGVSEQARLRGEYTKEHNLIMMFEDRSDIAEQVRKHCRVLMMWPSFNKEVQWPI